MENIRKVSKIQVLTLLTLIVVLVLLFPIPMPRSREELYMTTETYYDEVPDECMHCRHIDVPYAVNETVSIPYQIVSHMQWQVTWYTITVSGQWGASIGTQLFDSTFYYNWGSGSVYGSYSDGIGFKAQANFYLEAAGMYTFTLGSDDGSRLYIDEAIAINLWSEHDYQEDSSLQGLSEGWHNMTIWYYDWTGPARVYFNVDKGDLFTWEETQYLTIQIPRIHYSEVWIPKIQIQLVQKQRTTVANRTVTETVYSSLLEYLMKGGKP
jgi:hypothetical protein